MKLRTRYLLALTLVATTLCAGRLFASDAKDYSASREFTAKFSEKLVARLTRSLSRSVSRTPLVIERRMTSAIIQPVVCVSTNRLYDIPLAPLEMNLPPPLV